MKEKKQTPKTSETTPAASTKTQAEPKKSIRDLVEGNAAAKSTNQEATGSGYFIQIGAFSKRPSESYFKKYNKPRF